MQVWFDRLRSLSRVVGSACMLQQTDLLAAAFGILDIGGEERGCEVVLRDG